MLNTLEGKNCINIADVRAERLFREAEDDFFYFNNIASAIEKLENALMYLPNMLKALMLRANIAFLEGDFDLALVYYKRAESFVPNNAKVLAGLANIYEITNQNDIAYEYIEKAMSCGCFRYSGLSKALVDLKFAVLIKLKRYSEAKKVLDASRSFLTIEDYSELQKNNLLILKQKLALQKKIEKINLKVVK